jgi:hypothetical protein
MPAMNLIAGSTIRQGRTSLKCPPEVLEIKDGASQPGMIVRQGNPVRESSQKYQSQSDLLLDLVTITIPDELRDALIESIDIVDTSLVDRRANLDEYGDPFLILYAVTLERYP